MVGPVLMHMRMHDTWGGQLMLLVRMRAFQVEWMIMPAPQMLRIIVHHEQALTMMPAITEDIIILLALCRSLLFTEAIPLAVWVLLQQRSQRRQCQHAIARGFEEETEMDVHETVKAKFFIDPANLRQQFTSEGHQIALNSIDIWPLRLAELAQIIGDKTIGANYTDIAISQRHCQRLPDIAIHLDRGIHQHDIASTTGAHRRVASGGKAHIVVGKQHLELDSLSLLRLQVARPCQLFQVRQRIVG